jgi:glycosyltransferase involved in cell wall biosynthesis
MSDPRVAVARVPLVRPLRPATDARALGAVRRLLTEHQSRLLHTHMAKAGTIGRLAASSLGRRPPRMVHTFHGHVLEGYFRPEVQRMFVEVERRLARRTDALVAVSPQIRDDLLALGIGTPSQYRIVPLGLDLSRFSSPERVGGRLRGRLGLAPEVPLVGVAGRLVPIKDVGTLLTAIARLPGVHVALLGDGELRGPLEAQARHLGIEHRSHFLGWYDDVAGAMADCDVVALSSLNEGTPVAMIEALAGATPVVATDVGGVGFVVRDGVTGRLAPPGDPAALAEQLQRVLEDPEDARRMASIGQAEVLERFSHRRLIADICALYASIGVDGMNDERLVAQ